MTIITKSTNNKFQRVWRKRNLSTLWVGMHIGRTIMENSMKVPSKNTELSYDPAIPLLSMYPENTTIKKIHAPQCSLQH